jgi:hypothetical protein
MNAALLDYYTFIEAISALKQSWQKTLETKVEWTTGGMSGGNCWGGEPDHPVTAEEEPDDVLLEEILEIVLPDLRFLEYKKLIRADVYAYTEDSRWEYYGNYTEYKTRTLKLDKLYSALVELVHNRTK